MRKQIRRPTQGQHSGFRRCWVTTLANLPAPNHEGGYRRKKGRFSFRTSGTSPPHIPTSTTLKIRTGKVSEGVLVNELKEATGDEEAFPS